MTRAEHGLYWIVLGLILLAAACGWQMAKWVA